MSEPREWWIDEEYGTADKDPGELANTKTAIHVIEFSAFEEMQDLFIKENDRYREVLEKIAPELSLWGTLARAALKENE